MTCDEVRRSFLTRISIITKQNALEDSVTNPKVVRDETVRDYAYRFERLMDEVGEDVVTVDALRRPCIKVLMLDFVRRFVVER